MECDWIVLFDKNQKSWLIFDINPQTTLFHIWWVQFHQIQHQWSWMTVEFFRQVFRIWWQLNNNWTDKRLFVKSLKWPQNLETHWRSIVRLNLALRTIPQHRKPCHKLHIILKQIRLFRSWWRREHWKTFKMKWIHNHEEFRTRKMKLINWRIWFKRLKMIFKIYNLISKNNVCEQKQFKIRINCKYLSFGHFNFDHVGGMNFVGKWHGCVSWTLWKRCLHEKGNHKNHRKKQRHVHRDKMICGLYHERRNKTTMTMKSNVFRWWFSFVVFIKGIAGKYNAKYLNKWNGVANNDLTYHRTENMYQ